MSWIRTFELEIFATFFALFLTCVVYRIVCAARSNFPPGPWGLPIVGYFPFLTDTAYLQFMELGKKYGKVFSLRLGSSSVVVLNGAEPIREAFSKSEFSGRPPHTAFDILDRESPFFGCGIPMWSEHRRFVVHAMRDLGLGQSKIEDQIQDEVSRLMSVLRASEGRPFDLSVPLTPSVSNNISSLVLGVRFEYASPERRMLDANLRRTTDVLAQTSAHIFFPWVGRMLPLARYREGRKAHAQSETFFRERVRERAESLDPKHVRDFVDSYLAEMEARKRKDPLTTMSERALLGCMSDLFGAGSETVKTTVLWAVYTMAARPDAQRRVRAEIDGVLGGEGRAAVSHMRLMPYTHAVLLEVMRWKTVTPLVMLRHTLEDTSVGGFDVPKGTTVLANLWAAHHDPRRWGPDADSFVPDRFLDRDGLTVRKPSDFMPFSHGKRLCPGENMAYMEVFLYFVSIFQKFDVRFPDGFEPTFEAKLTVTYRLEPYVVHFTPRESSTS